MIKLIRQGVYYMEGRLVKEQQAFMTSDKKAKAIKGTLTHRILAAHGAGEGELSLRFDALVSHDITYVGIIQSARASGMKEFPLPYILTNCHNALCAVGGTVNGDDHAFGLSAAKKYGGEYVPADLAVIHQYIRERWAKCGSMILGSDSHTRYGALGTLAIGEGGPELVKQLLSRPYTVSRPQVVAVYLKGKLRHGVGAFDAALALIREVFPKGFAKNKILEFVGPGIRNLSMDERNGLDVMTTETGCLSSIWETDDRTEEYFRIHGRAEDFKPLHPAEPSYYDGGIVIDLSRIEPMIALPFHPSNAYPIREFTEHAEELLHQVEEQGRALQPGFTLAACLREDGVYATQAVIGGCAGGSYENISEAANLLRGGNIGSNGFSLSVYPASQPIMEALVQSGTVGGLISEGAIVKPAFCGPCFGAGDTPANNGLSIRHTTRNFENREGSKPQAGQLAVVALMDARSIAATAANGGRITSALGAEYHYVKKYSFDGSAYQKRVYCGIGKPKSEEPLVLGPGISDWPKIPSMGKHLLIKAVSVLTDPVTTTDELIPSGETSSYRSDPMKLASFTLSRKDPGYVMRAKQVLAMREEGGEALLQELNGFVPPEGTTLGSAIVSVRPGEGSAREQAASCQRVLGGVANICSEYATKRYRSNLINWGILPFTVRAHNIAVGDYLFVENIAELLSSGATSFPALLLSKKKPRTILLETGELTEEERAILLSGCLINYQGGRR